MLVATRPRLVGALSALLALALLLALVPAPPAAASERTAERIGGQNRYETAALTAFDAFSPADVDTVYLATGENFPDALAAGACAAEVGAPVLLTPTAALAAATADAFEAGVLASPPAPVYDVDARFAPSKVVVAGGASAVGPAVEAAFGAGVEVERQAGATRYETAKLLALDCFDPAEVDTVYLATGQNFPDSLAAVPAAARDGAPLLLTVPQGLHSEAIEALNVFQPDRIVLVGGTGVLTQGVVDGLVGQGYTEEQIERISGRDRYATGAALARSVFDEADRAFVATGEDFADALGGGAAAAHLDVPLVLTRSAFLPGVARQALAELGVARCTILGGEAAVSAAVFDDCDTDLPEFAYSSFGSGGQQYLVGSRADETTRPITELRSGVFDVNARFSPDGTQMALTRITDRDARVGDLAVTGVGDTVTENLTSFAEDRVCLVEPTDWNAAADTIAWTCNPDEGASSTGIVTLGGDLAELTAPEGSSYSAAQFLPDGDLFAVRYIEGADTELVRLDPDAAAGGGTVLATVDNAPRLGEVVLSPDGSQVAFTRPVDPDETKLRPEATLLVVDLDDGSAFEIFEGDPDRHSFMGWHPDGAQLLVATGGYSDGENRLRLVDAATGDIDSEILGPDDVAPGRTIGTASLSPDGSFILYAEANTNEDTRQYTVGRLFTVNVDGSDRQELEQAGTRANNSSLNAAALE